MAGKIDTVRLNKVLPRVEAPINRGLSSEQARERLENGYANVKPDSAEKTVGQIFKDNLLTYFNLVFMLLAMCIIAVGSYKDLMFMTIVLANSFIGIVQELRSRSALNKLTFMSTPQASVIRDGARVAVPFDETVLDDVAVFSAGNQIYADAIVLGGECNVNEALVTGESDEISKSAGDTLLSGSFVISGECAARLDKVGRESFAAKLTLEAKKTGGKRKPGMVLTLQRLVRFIGIIIIPLGALLYIRQTRQIGVDITNAAVSTVAALIGMIPEGLYLLVSVALTVSVLRLAQRKTLVHEMGCVELLARVNVLCVDKTGTITENEMEVKGVVPLCADRYSIGDVNMIMIDYAGNMPADNETMVALGAYFSDPPKRRARNVAPFSSTLKYGGVSFHEDESYFLGAPERILRSQYAKHRSEIEKYSAQGYRVLLLALYDSDINQSIDDKQVMPLALILLSNRVREQAPGTFKYFAQQGVKIIVISGDNPVTVSQIAGEAGIEGAERYVDAAELTTDRQIRRAVGEYVVFGRVTPDQKRKLVRALKAAGHTVAMTGDGVNDVLALKDADCSIAMASGSEVASQVADIVLLDSDFSSMPAVVMEGRRVINNIERSAALFLTKNIFSFMLAIVTLIFAMPYPLSPSQLSLFNGMLIGVPSFVLALEPNKSIVRGRFLMNVILSALPAGLTDFAALATLVALSPQLGIPPEEMSTMACIVIAFVGFLMLYRLCRPLNKLRISLIVCMFLGFSLGGIILSDLFSLSPLSGQSVWATIVICLASMPVMLAFSFVFKPRKHAPRRSGTDTQ
ncbi:MAG: HAD-IC family P-type ATPase [Oscillospiraceae bacterium]|nr:HAD-IC family P-type ATPase [Oscillospiraceae bacterium]